MNWRITNSEKYLPNIVKDDVINNNNNIAKGKQEKKYISVITNTKKQHYPCAVPLMTLVLKLPLLKLDKETDILKYIFDVARQNKYEWKWTQDTIKRYFKILMDCVEDYASQWAKREKEDLDILSEWVKSVRSLMQIRI